MAGVKTKKVPINHNRARKRFRKHLCIDCGSEKIRPVKRHGYKKMWWNCKGCNKTNQHKKIVDL